MATTVDILVRNLVRLLDQQAELHGELASLMRELIEAAKRADIDAIQALAARQGRVLERATEREGLRRELTGQILDAIGLDEASQGGLRLSELAGHLPEPLRTEVLVAASGLKRRVQDIERVRVTAALVTHGMIEHLNEVLAVMTGGVVETDMYSPIGRRGSNVSANVFEAVG